MNITAVQPFTAPAIPAAKSGSAPSALSVLADKVSKSQEEPKPFYSPGRILGRAISGGINGAVTMGLAGFFNTSPAMVSGVTGAATGAAGFGLLGLALGGAAGHPLSGMAAGVGTGLVVGGASGAFSGWVVGLAAHVAAGALPGVAPWAAGAVGGAVLEAISPVEYLIDKGKQAIAEQMAKQNG